MSENKNWVVGCNTVLITVLSLAYTIFIICHMSGFWYCTGAFFMFFISGLIGGGLGAAVGFVLAGVLVKDDEPLKQIGVYLAGILVGMALLMGCVGKFIYGFRNGFPWGMYSGN